MAEIADLKPCPFCDGTASMRYGGPCCYFVQCDECNATGDDHSQELAIEVWNRRALDAKDKRIAELQAAGRWQPIETAPTNRAILIRLPGLDYYGNDGVYAGMLVDMGTGQRWITFGWAIGRDVGSDWPDVWQPLPAPPSRLLNKEDRNG